MLSHDEYDDEIEQLQRTILDMEAREKMLVEAISEAITYLVPRVTGNGTTGQHVILPMLRKARESTPSATSERK